MIKVSIFCVLIMALQTTLSFAQLSSDRFVASAPREGFAVRVSGYILFNGGAAISIGCGFWRKFEYVQPSFNTSFNVLLNRHHIGNRDRIKTNWQINTIFSPMLTIGTGRGFYEEINPFYMSSAGAVYNNYRYSMTLGTSFVTMPKGKGVNISTSRNRGQQLLYVQLRIGGKDTLKENALNSFVFNIYEDYFAVTDNSIGQIFVDNFDRFYTGGANIQFRFCQFYKIKVYSEIYTGTSQIDRFDYPDLVQLATKKDTTMIYEDIGKESGWRFFAGPKRKKRWVSQEAGQKMLNNGQTLLTFEFPLSKYPSHLWNHPTGEVYFGTQGGNFNMWSQNMIHNAIKIKKVAMDSAPTNYNPEGTLIHENRYKDRFHRFKPNMDHCPLVLGFGTHYRIGF
jgi:hypothetical protein